MMPNNNILEKIRENISSLESHGNTQSEDVFLGVSALSQEATDLLNELGWYTIYAGSGFYDFHKKQ